MTDNVVSFAAAKEPDKPQQGKKENPVEKFEFGMIELVGDAQQAGVSQMMILRIIQTSVDELLAKLNWKECAGSAWQNRHLLRAGEIDFIQQLRYYRANPSAKQVMWLDDIIRTLNERAELLANPPPPRPRRKPKKKADATAER
jgi:hypothetical protein